MVRLGPKDLDAVADDGHRFKHRHIVWLCAVALLGPEWLDHPLGGDWDGHRECHIGGDFLLAYKLVDSAKHGLVVFVRAGTHAELFE